MGSRRKSVPADDEGVKVPKVSSGSSGKRKSDSFLQSLPKKTSSSSLNSKPETEQVRTGPNNNNELKKRFLVPSTLFMDDVNKAVSKAFTKKSKKESVLHKGKKSKIPVPVHHPPEAEQNKPEEYPTKAVKSDEKEEPLRSCLHIYRPPGSVKKQLRWAVGIELEKIKLFFRDDSLDMDASSGFKRYKSTACLDHLLEKDAKGWKSDQFEDNHENISGFPVRKLLPMPEVKCFAVTPEGLVHQSNNLSEESKDLTNLTEEDTTPLSQWSECWKEDKGSEDDSHLQKWPSGLLSDVLDSCEAMFPSESMNSWDKFRKRGPSNTGSGDTTSGSPAKRPRTYQSSPKIRNKSILITSPALEFDEWDPLSQHKQEMVHQVPSDHYYSNVKQTTAEASGPLEPLQDPRLARRGVLTPSMPVPKSPLSRESVCTSPSAVSEHSLSKNDDDNPGDSNSSSLGPKCRLSIVPRLMILANYGLADQ